MAWSDVLRPTRLEGAVQLFEGVAASSPATLDEPVDIMISAFSDELLFGPAPWMPRVDAAGATVLITNGARCLIGAAETPDAGEPEYWVIAWWPFET